MFLLLICLYGCPAQEITVEENNETVSVSEIPSWVENPPQDKKNIYATGNASSDDLSIALRQAKKIAVEKIEVSIKNSLRAWQEEYIEQNGSDTETEIINALESSIQTDFAENLEDIEDIDRTTRFEEGKYNAWFLIRVNINDIIDQLSETQTLKNNFSKEDIKNRLFTNAL